MTFTEFVTKYNGQKNVGNTAENKGQCVGLIANWVDELNLPHIWGHAMDLFVNADEKFFQKILNTPDAIPIAGDIIVWNKKFNGTVGHTGLATSTGTTSTFECFEQNDPLGSACHMKTYNYNSITGWLRPEQPITTTGVSEYEKKLTELRDQRDDNWDMYAGLCDKLKINKDYKIALIEAERFLSLEEELRKSREIQSSQAKEIEANKTEAQSIKIKVEEQTKSIELAQDAIIKLKKSLDNEKIKNDDLLLRIKIIETTKPIDNMESGELMKAGWDKWIQGIKKWFNSK